MKRISKTTYDEFSQIIDEIDKIILELTGIDMKKQDKRAKEITETFSPAMKKLSITDGVLIINNTKNIF